MIEVLRQHILTRLGPHATRMDEVLEHFKCLRVERNSLLLRQGDVCSHVYYVASGCLQVYIYDSAYNETTRDIVTEDHWCSELMSFGRQIPATENIRAVEDTVLLSIGFASFQQL